MLISFDVYTESCTNDHKTDLIKWNLLLGKFYNLKQRRTLQFTQIITPKAQNRKVNELIISKLFPTLHFDYLSSSRYLINKAPLFYQIIVGYNGRESIIVVANELARLLLFQLYISYIFISD